MFLVNVTLVNKDKITEDLLQQHIAYVQGCYANTEEFVHIGTLMDEGNGVYIFDFNDQGSVMKLLHEDPFFKENIAEYKVSEYLVRHNSIGSIGNW